MSWHDIELLTRGGTLSLLALWCWLLWRDHRAILSARIGIAMNLGIASYVVSTAGWTEASFVAFMVLGILSQSTPALFWLFAKTWFNDRSLLTRSDQLILALWIANAVLFHLALWYRWPILLASAVVFRSGLFILALAGLWEAWRGREGDLVEGRRRMRLGIIVTVGIYVLIIGGAEIAVYDANAPTAILGLIGGSTAFTTLAFCAAMFSTRQGDMFGPPLPKANPAPPMSAAEDPLAARLANHMTKEMPHRDENLTIASLAQRLGEQEYRLRRLINGTLGYRNFAQFLNGFRLAEVKSALADPAQREVPILTIALDAGFGSLGPFNRAFREAEGMTPSEYRARHLIDSEIG